MVKKFCFKSERKQFGFRFLFMILFSCLILTANAQEKGIFLETAHPVKFKNEIEPVIGKEIELPEELYELMNQSKKAFILEADYENLFDYLISI